MLCFGVFALFSIATDDFKYLHIKFYYIFVASFILFCHLHFSYSPLKDRFLSCIVLFPFPLFKLKLFVSSALLCRLHTSHISNIVEFPRSLTPHVHSHHVGPCCRNSTYCLHPAMNCLHPTTYCLLPTMCCLHPTTYCLHLTKYCLHPTTYYLHPITYCPHPSMYYLYPTTYCLQPTRYFYILLHIVYFPLCIIYIPLHIVYNLLHIIYILLQIVYL